MAKVTTLLDFRDKTDIDKKTGEPKLVAAGSTIDVTRERHAELAAVGILPPLADAPGDAAAAVTSNK